MVTEAQLRRIQSDWSRIAGEDVAVEEIKGTIYGYCSELGALRLLKKNAVGPKSAIAEGRAKADFSKNMNTWFFRLETGL